MTQQKAKPPVVSRLLHTQSLALKPRVHTMPGRLQVHPQGSPIAKSLTTNGACKTYHSAFSNRAVGQSFLCDFHVDKPPRCDLNCSKHSMSSQWKVRDHNTRKGYWLWPELEDEGVPADAEKVDTHVFDQCQYQCQCPCQCRYRRQVTGSVHGESATRILHTRKSELAAEKQERKGRRSKKKTTHSLASAA